MARFWRSLRRGRWGRVRASVGRRFGRRAVFWIIWLALVLAVALSWVWGRQGWIRHGEWARTQIQSMWTRVDSAWGEYVDGDGGQRMLAHVLPRLSPVGETAEESENGGLLWWLYRLTDRDMTSAQTLVRAEIGGARRGDVIRTEPTLPERGLDEPEAPTDAVPEVPVRSRDIDGQNEIDDADQRPSFLASTDWGSEPLVLIFHSHTSESYRTDPPDPRADAMFHVTNETDTGITRVGAAMAQTLRKYGIGVIHSVAVHNYPHHWEAYVHARRTVQETLERYPSIKIVLDVHRQGIPDAVWATTIDGQQSVKVEIIYTTASEAAYGEHPDWRDNQQFAYQLADNMDAMYPGLLQRVTVVADKRYNQDLFPHMVLLEVGNYLDWEEHAIVAGRLVGDAVAATLHDLIRDGAARSRPHFFPDRGPVMPPAPPQPEPLARR